MNSSQSDESRLNLYFKIDGKALQNGLDIHVTVSALREMQYILDRSYLALSEGKHLRKIDREAYQLVAEDLKLGSLELTLTIALDSSVLNAAVPLVIHFGPKRIWELAKNAFDFLEFLYSLRDTGKPISINVNGIGNTVVVVHGDESYATNALTYNVARKIRPGVLEIAKLAQANGLDSFQISSSKEENGIRIDKENARRFTASTEILSTPVDAECELLRFDKNRVRGRLRVLSSPALPRGEYPFVGQTRDRDLLAQALALRSVALRVRQEITFDPFEPQKTKIVRLHVLPLAS